jgi:leucine dehydrogenase
VGIKASVKEKFNSDTLKGLRVAVQGLGNVGSNLVKYLVEEGAKVIIADIDQDKVKALMAKYPGLVEMSVDKILFADYEEIEAKDGVPIITTQYRKV